MMLTAMIAGLAMVYLLKLVRLKALIRTAGAPEMEKWARMERASVNAFLWTGLGVCGLNIAGLFFFQSLGTTDLGQWSMETYMAPAFFIWPLIAVIAIGGLVVSAVRGSRAKKYRAQAKLESPIRIGVLSRISMFMVGWFGYLILFQVCGHVARRLLF